MRDLWNQLESYIIQAHGLLEDHRIEDFSKENKGLLVTG